MKKNLNITIVTIKTTVTTGIEWASNQLAALWEMHTQALRTRSSYRAEIVALVIGVVGLLAIDAPLDMVIAAAVSAYVTYYKSQEGGPGFDMDPFM